MSTPKWIAGLSVLALVTGVLVQMPCAAAIPSSQRDALLALYSATGGTSWTNHTNWGGASGTEGTWYGVTVYNPGSGDTVLTLDLHGNNLVGSLPAALGDLPGLVTLRLYNNKLSGSLPGALGSLSALADLELNGNQLTGSIPNQLGNLSQLQYLFLYSNQLTGSIPPSLGSLAHLVKLSLYGNQLSGAIPPELGGLSSLVLLELSSNQLTGSIPPSLGNLSAINSWMNLGINQLTGEIPPELGQLKLLPEIYLDHNQLSGKIPPELGDMTSLRTLYLDDNQLDGEIPGDLGGLSQLVTLNLSHNQLSGALPPELGGMTNLTALVLNYNQLSGAIPSELGALSKLAGLNLDHNQLSGAIPTQLGSFGQLQAMFLNNNHLTGGIPTTFSGLVKVQALFLDDNLLTGSIPFGLGALTALQALGLQNNKLTGSIPAELGNLVHLRALYLNSNQLSGAIPASLGSLSSLQALNLDANTLTDPIPASLGSLANLQSLRLNENQLTGSIPSQLGNLTALQELLLYTNKLTGAIPAELGNLSHLKMLLLFDNQLSGSIPESLGSLAALQGLGLHLNRLSGTIPASLGSLSALYGLGLHGNMLEGPIPSSLMNLTALAPDYLDLRWNMLYTSDETLAAFLDSRQVDGDWRSTQTVAPLGTQALGLGPSSIRVSWTPIAYSGDAGSYRVYASEEDGGPYTLVGETPDKTTSSLDATGLSPDTSYCFVVTAHTAPNDNNANDLESPYSAEACSSTCSPASIGTPPQGTTIASGQSTTLTVGASGSPTLTYQWYQGPSGTSTTPVGTNSPSFTTPALTQTTSYWVRVSNGCGAPADSAAAVVTVTCTPPNIGSPPQGTTITSGQSTTLTVGASGSPTLAYQWYQGASGVTTTPVGTNASSFTTPALTQTTSYWVRVSNGCGAPADSAAAVVTVTGGCTAPSITTPPLGTTIVSGQSTTLTVGASGSPTLAYQWYQGASGVTTTPVGTNSSSFTTPPLAQTTSYWVRVSNGCGTPADSATAVVTVTCTPPNIGTQPQGTTIPPGQSTTLTASATGSATLAYQWYQGAPGVTTTPVGTNSSSFTTPALTQTTSYWVRVSNGCGTPADSAAAVVTVCTLNCSASAPALGTVGLPVSFTGGASWTGGCTQAVTYDWNFGDGSAHGAVQSPTHTYASAGSKTWTLTITAGGASCVRTGMINLVNGPVISSMTKLGSPFRISVTGSNLKNGIQVSINGTPWTNLKWKSETLFKIKGGGSLKALVPKGVPTTFHFVNPDGGEAFQTWHW
jgi:Leucine-rich repeat (LRR) protein